MNMLSIRITADTGLVHNDVCCYNNVLRDDQGRLFLIDFEHATGGVTP